MKKLGKKLIVLAAATALVAGPVSTPVSAQTIFDKTFFSELHESNKAYNAVSAEGYFQLSMASQGQNADLGRFSFNASFNGEPLALSFKGGVTSVFINMPINVSLILKDGISYVESPVTSTDGTLTSQWMAFDISKQEQQFLDAFSTLSKEKLVDTDVLFDFNEKYLDVTETDSTFVVNIKENIDANQLWTDINNVVDLEAVKQEAIKQVETESGTTLTDVEKAQIDRLYSVDTLATLLAMNPKVTSTYDKATKLLQSVEAELPIDLQELAKLFADTTTGINDTLQALPQNMTFKFSLNLSGHNQPQEVTVPAEALEVEVQQVEETSTN